MEIKIRNVDPIAVKKIDELAKERKVSRQEFLKSQLETLAFFRKQTDRENELENLIEKNIKMMEKCAVSMENMNHILLEMIGDPEE
ncbi:hypothetical protein H8R29_28300 (plasmid) [Priestia megaterium]|uniref:Ribbon-helix-helix protein CopG domain-containing protein n=1 Tax=Priestia megaterium (strain ATCC 14581 / DSM 32 / CCUG 1817 / JCM 2506 / NBRC 15308 / NCIMB 9376 / NCTC 10342 / NRRL B-14308 / VKM B-512 / Ford 19) TaxID=1348623 RepID=A0A0B6B0S3_PRIM2|nr:MULTISPECIES: hypothetical protein [Priestia]AJI25774.1 hypothetical protein BG04_5838 [Priestia megaterium NBRC 15308 = ATCC 14581]KFM95518.1 hypothetical protein DJ91_5516 [Priestia megaterium]KGJ81350.1 hypothetical protein BMT_19235 [Priestia megaterium NBRC 15308 = ATCC 14581]MBZ6488427.1 hypothetical protein [Priestia aryabhattai]MDH3130140.1 hypothetical protein [Priestia aryabhattai]